MTSNIATQTGLDPLLDDRVVEKITGRARSTLQKDRVAGRGIPFVRIGRLVRYRQSDVERYLADLPAYHSTSEAGATMQQQAARTPRHGFHGLTAI